MTLSEQMRHSNIAGRLPNFRLMQVSDPGGNGEQRQQSQPQFTEEERASLDRVRRDRYRRESGFTAEEAARIKFLAWLFRSGRMTS